MNEPVVGSDTKSLMEKISGKFYWYMTRYRTLTLISIILVYILIFSIAYSRIFPTFYNLSAVMLAMSIESIIVIGMAILLISGEIDLSVGFNMSLAGIICTHLVVYEKMEILPAFVITMIISIIMGLLVGILVAKIGVNSFITTLAAGLIYFSLALKLSNGSTITHLPAEFNVIGQKVILGFQIPVWYALIIFLVFTYLMSKTRVFRQYYYIGANKKAAVLSGIDVGKMKILAFIISSMLASFAGIISAARFGNAMALVGQGMELKAITAAVIGGISFTGGVGTVVGASVGELFMALLNNGLIIAEVNQFWHQIIIGVIMLLAVITDVILARKRV